MLVCLFVFKRKADQNQKHVQFRKLTFKMDNKTNKTQRDREREGKRGGGGGGGEKKKKKKKKKKKNFVQNNTKSQVQCRKTRG